MIVVVMIVVDEPDPRVYVRVELLTLVTTGSELEPVPAGATETTGTTEVTMAVDSAGQSVTVGAQLVIVIRFVENRVSVSGSATAVPLPN